jgi:hypothetical protein
MSVQTNWTEIERIGKEDICSVSVAKHQEQGVVIVIYNNLNWKDKSMTHQSAFIYKGTENTNGEFHFGAKVEGAGIGVHKNATII